MIYIWEASDTRNLNDKGFTLVEIMVTMVVVMVMALALGRLNANTWNTTDMSKAYTEGSTLAAQHLESLFSEKYASDQASGMSAAVTAGASHDFQSPDGHYNISYSIRDDLILPGTKSVLMNVSFKRGAVTKSIEYNYLLPLRK